MLRWDCAKIDTKFYRSSSPSNWRPAPAFLYIFFLSIFVEFLASCPGIGFMTFCVNMGRAAPFRFAWEQPPAEFRCIAATNLSSAAVFYASSSSVIVTLGALTLHTAHHRFLHLLLFTRIGVSMTSIYEKGTQLVGPVVQLLLRAF